MIFIGTTHYITVQSAAEATTDPPRYVVSYARLPTKPTGGITQITGATSAVARMVVPPPTGERILWHQLIFLSVRNEDTVAHHIQISIAGGSKTVELIGVDLGVNETLFYTQETGWQLYDTTGTQIDLHASIETFDSIAPTTTKGDLIAHDGSNNVREPVGADTHVLTADSAQASGVKWAPAPGAGGGEANTGSNQGADGVGVFRQKTGVDLEFRHVAPASAKITVVLNGQDIDIDLGAVAFADLSDVTGKTGAGTEAVMSDSPVIVTPTIADLTNMQHDHADAAGGGVLPGGGGGDSMWGFSGVAATVSKGATGYVGTGGAVTATEADAEFYCSVAGDFSDLRTYVSANASNNAANTVTINKNGVAGALQTSYGAGVTGLASDLVGTITVAEGDRISVEVVNTGSGGGTKDLVLESVSMKFTPS